jgi:hypothetical protein
MAKKVRKEPKVGDVFEHRYKGEYLKLTVVATDSGIGYELFGQIYSSPTAAAKAVVGRDASINGRGFWHIDD